MRNTIYNDNKESIPMFKLMTAPKIENKIEIQIPETQTQNYNTGRWTEEEHQKFVDGILKYGNDWKKVQELIQTRSSTQARSHAQKFFLKIKKHIKINDNEKPFNLVNEGSTHKYSQDKFSVKYFSEILSPQNKMFNSTKEAQQLLQEREKLFEILNKFKAYSNSSDSSQISNCDDSLENSTKQKSKKQNKNMNSLLKKQSKKLFNIRKLSTAANSTVNGIYDEQFWSNQKNCDINFISQNETTFPYNELLAEENYKAEETTNNNYDYIMSNFYWKSLEEEKLDKTLLKQEENIIKDNFSLKKEDFDFCLLDDEKETNSQNVNKKDTSVKDPFYIDFFDNKGLNKDFFFKAYDNNFSGLSRCDDENELSILKM